MLLLKQQTQGSTTRFQRRDVGLLSGRSDGRNGQDQKPGGSEPGVSRSMKTGLKKHLLGGIKKTRTCGKYGMRPSRRRRDHRAKRTSQYSASISVRLPRPECVQLVFQHPRVLVATLCFQENPHSCLQILHAAMLQVLRSAYMLPRVLSTTGNQEAQELLDEIQQQPGVFVPSGPAVAITNVVTANEFLADGWSTEPVSRVVRAARTKQGKQWEGARRTRTLQLHTRRDDDFRHLSRHSSGTRSR